MRDLQTLIELLRRQQELYRQLLNYQNDKLALFVEGGLKPIDGELAREQSLVIGISEVEQRIKNMLGDATLSQVLVKLDEPERATLKSLINELQNVLSELNRVNLRNYRYVQNSISYTQSVLQQIFNQSSIYGPNGHLRTGTEEMRRREISF